MDQAKHEKSIAEVVALGARKIVLTGFGETNRHNLPPEEAVKLSNTDLYNLVDGKQLEADRLSARYREKTT